MPEQKLLFTLQYFATGKVLLSCAVVTPSVLLFMRTFFILWLFTNIHQYIYFHRQKIRITWHFNQFQQKKKEKSQKNNIKKFAENSIQNVKKLYQKYRKYYFFLPFYHLFTWNLDFFWHFAEVHAIYNAHICSRSISRNNLNHGTTSLVKLTT